MTFGGSGKLHFLGETVLFYGYVFKKIEHLLLLLLLPVIFGPEDAWREWICIQYQDNIIVNCIFILRKKLIVLRSEYVGGQCSR